MLVYPTSARASLMRPLISPASAMWLLPSRSLSTSVVPPKSVRPNASGV